MEEFRYILDTTYILPFFGIDIDIPGLKKDMEVLLTEEPVRPRFMISSCSIIEAKWSALREYRTSQDPGILDRYREAMLSIVWRNQILLHQSFLDETANLIADRLWLLGHPDLMDCWIAGSAVAVQAALVTEDVELKDIMKECSETNKTRTLSWEELQGIL